MIREFFNVNEHVLTVLLGKLVTPFVSGILTNKLKLPLWNFQTQPNSRIAELVKICKILMVSFNGEDNMLRHSSLRKWK